MSESKDYPLYKYEVEIKQVIHKVIHVEASDVKSAREQGCEDFHMDESGGYELDVVGCDLIE